MMLKAFSASEDEITLANRILLLSNCQEGDALQSDVAFDVFATSGLSYDILCDIWRMTDENESGELTKRELTAAIRLMGWAQAGESLEESLLTKSGPLPTLDGVTDVVGKRNVISPQSSRFPPVNPDDVRRFKRAFNDAGTLGGFLDGDLAMEVYMASNLSYGELWKIRKLVDVTERGALDFREFAMGMYLIQALQSCSIVSVPSTIPPDLYELFSDPKLFDVNPKSQRPSHPRLSKSPSLSKSPALSKSPSLHTSPSPSHLQVLPFAPGSNIPLTPSHSPPSGDYWDVSPIERLEADKHFQKLDLDHKGYIEGKTVASFMSSYKLSSIENARIWNLVDLNNDNRLTKDLFAVALYLINRTKAGEDIPISLPPSLVPPSMRTKGTFSSTPTPMSPKLLAKFKSPPPPPPKRVSSVGKRPHSSGSACISSTISDHLSGMNPTPPLPPSWHTKKSSNSPSSFSTSPPNQTNPFETLFEDTANGNSTPTHHSPPRPSKLLPPDYSNNEALEEFKKETTRLTLQVESLLSQLTAQNKLRDANETLQSERDSLRAQMREMERTVSEVLSANDQNGSQEQYIQEIGRLSTELANKEAQHESTQRMLTVLTEEDKDLRRQLRESQMATAKAKSEAEDLRESVASHEAQITDLSARLADMGKALAEEPPSASNNREMRVLFRDVTRENDSLKSQVRDMQTSMEQLLLSTKLHAKFDEVERENRRLKSHVQELEMFATQLQTTNNPHSSSSQRQQRVASEEVTRENEKLKAQLQAGHRAFAEYQSTSETKLGELQQTLAAMESENNRLKMELVESSSQGQRQEDSNVPPPAYNDSFGIPA